MIEVYFSHNNDLNIQIYHKQKGQLLKNVSIFKIIFFWFDPKL
jgi:hypothetical protein